MEIAYWRFYSGDKWFLSTRKLSSFGKQLVKKLLFLGSAENLDQILSFSLKTWLKIQDIIKFAFNSTTTKVKLWVTNFSLYVLFLIREKRSHW